MTPAVLGTAALMLARACGGGEALGLALAMSVTTAVRVLAIRLDWRLPPLASVAEPTSGFP